MPAPITYLTLWKGEAITIRVPRFRDYNSAYLNGLTGLTWTLKDSTNTTTIATGSLSYVSSSNGVYVGSIPGSTAVVVGTEYRLWITQSGYYLNREIYVIAQQRRQS